MPSRGWRFRKLEAVNFSFDVHQRYTFWSGLLGGLFLSLSYFGTDQSQVQRYLHGASLRESRLGLMFNAVCKIPMQFFILLLGALVFVFYQFEQPPVSSTKSPGRPRPTTPRPPTARACGGLCRGPRGEAAVDPRLARCQHAGNPPGGGAGARRRHRRPGPQRAIRTETRSVLHAADPRTSTNDSDYIFITFVIDHLPHGVIGLLVAVIFAAALSSKASELNALGATTTIDFYRHVVRRDAGDAHYVTASKWFSPPSGAWSRSPSPCSPIWWKTSFRQSISLVPFSTASCSASSSWRFFLGRVGGTAVFWAAVAGQILVFWTLFHAQHRLPLV